LNAISGAKAKIDECRLVHVPFWKITVAAVSQLEGYRIEADEVSDTKIPMDYSFDNYLTWNRIACEGAGIGIEFLRNLAGEKAQYDECHSRLEPVTLSMGDAEWKAKKAMEITCSRHDHRRDSRLCDGIPGMAAV
jgi:hypothetical protein